MHLLKEKPPAILVLEDGTVYRGYTFAGHGETMGEVVFNTGMSGYQEILTDPSYKEQIVVMTYPLIGNYGINPEDMESAAIHLEGLIIREYQPCPSNWRSTQTLKEFLESFHKIGLEGIDTRALTRRIRIEGAMKGIIATETGDIDALLERVRAYPGLVGRDLIRSVTCREPYLWQDGHPQPIENWSRSNDRYTIAVIDCGVKYNILRNLERKGCHVLVLPATATAEEVKSYGPDGVLLSNGPGDPAALPYLVETARNLMGQLPVFGICLGHQILGQALGGETTKLKFGHHGLNQPAKNTRNGRVEITSQNHGFTVVPETLPGNLEKTHTNLNDQTLEGLLMPSLKAFSVQYHPEAAPGPQDASYLFQDFLDLIEKEHLHKQNSSQGYIE